MFGHQGQPEPRAGTGAPPTRDRTAEESLEHLASLQGVDTRTVVFHADLHVPQTVHGVVRTGTRTVTVARGTIGHTGSTVASGQSSHADHGGPSAVVGGVLQQVGHHAFEAPFVDVDPK